MSVISDGTHKTPNYVEHGVPFLSVQNISKGYFDLNRIKYITQEEHEKLIQRVKPEKNDILICRIGTLGKAIKCTVDFEFSIFVSLGLLRPVSVDTTDYIVFAINSPIGDKWIQENKVGGGTHTYKINLVDIPNFLIPMPPLQEQQRIFKKMKELEPFLNEYNDMENNLSDLNATFPEALKKSILQQAVMGKLVPQDENDEPASVLLERIRAEKAQLIKAGKLKKDKYESIIYRRDNSHYEKLDGVERCIDDEIPFEIPDTWSWVRFSTIALFENGDRSNKYPVESDYVDSGIPFFGAKDMGEKYMSFDNVRYISDEKFKELGHGKLQDGDMICLLRGSVGKTRIFKENDKHTTGFICAQMLIIRCFLKDTLDYIYTVTSAPFYQRSLESMITGTAVKQLPAKELANVLIPLPSINEQSRIVTQMNMFLKHVGRL